MNISLTPTDTTLYRGQSYTFNISASSSYSVKNIYCSLSFFAQGDGYNPIISGYDFEYRDEAGFYNDSLSWSQTVTVPSEAIKATLHFSCVENELDCSSSIDYTAKTYIPTVAPSNFTAVQDGKHINFTWTAGSGEGTMTYCVHVGGEDSVPGCTTTTSTSSVCTDCSSYYGETVDFTLDYYLNGSIKGYLSYRLSVVTPSVSATITIAQASKSKQVTVSWNGSCSGFTATSKNFKISCSGSSGNLYDGSGSSSVSYTPPTYGTSYKYTNIFTASNTYGDSFSITVYKDFTATAPYYTVGVCINGQWTPCVAYVYRDGWKECHPYVYRDGWKLCDYS